MLSDVLEALAGEFNRNFIKLTEKSAQQVVNNIIGGLSWLSITDHG